MKKFRRLRTLTAILLAVILLISSVPAAFASSFSAYVKSSSMSVYSDSSLSKKIGALEQYTVVTVSAYSGGVARISYGGASGYAKVSDMEAVDSVAIRANVNTSTRVYKKASSSSSSASLPKGTQVNVIAIKGSWALIERNGIGGYTYVKYLTPVGQAATAEPTAAPTVDTSKAIPAVVTAASVTVYKSANTSSTVLGALKKGAALNVIAINGEWAYVERSGAYGYCKVSALTPASQAATPTPTPAPPVDTRKAIPAVVSAASVTVYKSANTSSTVLGTLKKGAALNVIAINGSWAYVERSGAYGYCKASALTPASQLNTPAPSQKLDAPVPAAATTSTKVYQEASTSSACIGTLSKGKEVNVVALTTDGKWAQIELNGKYGWCALSALEVIVEEDPLAGFVEEVFGATVVTTSAKFYDITGDGSGAKIALGTDVTVGAYDATWAFVKYGEKYGFIAISDLSRTSFSALQKGSTGTAVSTLEKALLAMGYFDAIPDTTYDSVTEAAVKLFQTACGLSATGSATEGLQRVLYSGNGPACSLLSTSLAKGATGANVTRVQLRLYALGYLSKTSSVDGDYGATTASAVSLFQACNNLTQTGTADTTTLRKMYSTSAATLPSGKTPADQGGTIIQPETGNQKNNSTSISSTLASVTKSYSSSMSNAEKLEYVIYVGQNQLGKPYVYGANGTSSYDCTGFTCYCFKQIGISLPRTAYNQGYSDTYPKISSASSLKRGDLVYFNTISDGDLSDHAGIYLGAGWFIHASSGQGKVVVSSLASGYYAGVFSWGRRVFN